MAKIYAALIKKGLKTIDDVPANLRADVEKILNDDKGWFLWKCVIFMEDLVMKTAEFGLLGVITFYLLTKGTAEIDKLAESNKKLADAVDKFFAKVTNIDVRVNSIEYELRNIGSRLDKIESLLLKGDKWTSC